MTASAPAPEPIRKDRRLAVGVEIRERIGKRFPHDPASIGPDAELTKRQACALKGKELLLRAVEGDLLLVALAPASLTGNL